MVLFSESQVYYHQFVMAMRTQRKKIPARNSNNTQSKINHENEKYRSKSPVVLPVFRPAAPIKVAVLSIPSTRGISVTSESHKTEGTFNPAKTAEETPPDSAKKPEQSKEEPSKEEPSEGAPKQAQAPAKAEPPATTKKTGAIKKTVAPKSTSAQSREPRKPLNNNKKLNERRPETASTSSTLHNKSHTSKKPPDKNKSVCRSDDRESGEASDRSRLSSAPLLKTTSQESEEAPPLSVVTQQPTSRYYLHRQSTTSDPTYPSDTKSIEPVPSTDSENRTAEGHYNTSGSSEYFPLKRDTKCVSKHDDPQTANLNRNQEPSTSAVHLHQQHQVQVHERKERAHKDQEVSGPSGQSQAKKSQPTRRSASTQTQTSNQDTARSKSRNQTKPDQNEDQTPYYEGITNVIRHHTEYDISRALPVSSEYAKRKHRGPYYGSLPQPGEYRVPVRPPVPFDLYDGPPSPAPSSPVRHRERSVYEDCTSARDNNEQQWEEIPWTYEEFEKLAYGRRKPKGPRRVVFKGLDPEEDAEGYSYRLQDEAAALPPNFNVRCSYYGAESPTQPFRSYLGPEVVAHRYVPATSFVKNIHEEENDPKDDTEPKGIMNPLEDHERKIIIEFCHLLEKSKQLFNGLRELPQYGHKQWSLYFGRTFDIYTRLWKYQQQHRAVLDSKYGMKRWQIGEIASKIGQLYYHFYLRTSETAYLNEAFSFYYAIRGRCYYTKANKEDKCELMVKKLRYYARFIVVCLLLNKMKLVKELIKELERQIIEYGNTYDPDDQVEWTVVVDEVKAFIHAEPVVSIVNTDNQTILMSHRLTPIITPPVERTSQMNLSLQEIVIVGSSSQQVKFSELTMDMFRMLQTLEREPSGDIQHIFDESPRQRFMSTPNAPSQGHDPQKQPNPHKYLLFKPSPSQMLVYLSSGCNDLPPNGALLLYISADGHVPQQPKHAEDGYELGGLITTSKNDIYRECNKDPKSSAPKHKEHQCFYPGDLYPFTRRPLFVIVDSDNSYAFQSVPRHFGQPLIVLMSPLDMPPSYHDPRRQGSLFTLFLHAPLEGLCYSCDLSSITLALWERAQLLIDTFMAEASTIIVRSRLVDPMYISFMGDDFFRLLITRYVFCEATLRLHRLFRGRSHRTRCTPALPDDLFEHPTLVHIIVDLANALQIRNHIQDPAMAPRERDGASGGN